MDKSKRKRSFWARIFGSREVGIGEIDIPAEASVSRLGPNGFYIENFDQILRNVFSDDFENALTNTISVFENGSVVTYERSPSLAGGIIPGSNKFYSIRLGFIVKFVENSAGGTNVRIFQLYADLTRRVNNLNPSFPITYVHLLKYSAYDLDGNLLISADTSEYLAEWYRFVGTTYSDLKTDNGISESSEELSEWLINKLPLRYHSDINVSSVEGVGGQYMKLVSVNSPPIMGTGLEFYNPDLDHVFFSESDFSMIHNRLIRDNGNISGGVVHWGPFKSDVFFSGAKINIGHVAAAMSQVEIVGSHKGVYPLGQANNDFTLKAEIVKVVNPGYNRPVGYGTTSVARMDGEEGEDEISGNNPALPLVFLGLPCPKIWEIQE